MARTAVRSSLRAAATNASPASAGDANVRGALFSSTALSALRHEASPVTATNVPMTHDEFVLFRIVCHKTCILLECEVSVGRRRHGTRRRRIHRPRIDHR